MQRTFPLTADNSINHRKVFSNRLRPDAAISIGKHKDTIKIEHHSPCGVIPMPIPIGKCRLDLSPLRNSRSLSKSAPRKEDVLSRPTPTPKEHVGQSPIRPIVPVRAREFI